MKKIHSVAVSAVVLTLAFFSYPSTGNALTARKQMLENRLVDIGGGGGGGGGRTTVAIDRVTIGGGGGGGTTVVNKFRCASGFSYSPKRYDSRGNEICITKPVINPIIPDPVIPDPVPDITPVVVTGTVSTCPSGTTKSSDGCCCINN